MTSNPVCVKLQYVEFKASGKTGTNIVMYDVENKDLPGDGWFCSCEDFYYRKHECKHIMEAKKRVRI